MVNRVKVRKMSREEWIVAAFELISTDGFEAIRVEPLAARLGVTKGSFYHHFDNRRSLHLAMLDAWEQRGTTEIIDDVEHTTDDSHERIRQLAHRTVMVDSEADAVENAIRAWAARDEVAAEAAMRVDQRRLDYTAALLRDIGIPAPLARRRAKLFYRVLIGEFSWRHAGGPAMTEREIDEAVDHLTSPATEPR